MPDVEGEKNARRAGQNSPALTRGILQSQAILLGAMQVDDSPGFVQLGSHERPLFNTAGLDVLTHKWKRLVSLWGLEFDLRLHLSTYTNFPVTNPCAPSAPLRCTSITLLFSLRMSVTAWPTLDIA